MTSILSAEHGTYVGDGTWRDAAGSSHCYRVQLTLEPRAGGLGLAYTHRFFEEPDQPDVTMDLTLGMRAPGILGADLGGLAVRGYWDDAVGLLAFAIPLPGNLVEATHLFSGGTCRVGGSSEHNSDGQYIAWSETLTREG